MAKRKDLFKRVVDVPMAKDAHESIRHAAHNHSTTYGVDGSLPNLHANGPREIATAREYDEIGYDVDGLNIATGRSNSTKFTGRK